MTEVRSREDKPLPGIDYSEILIHDEEDLGTGVFTTVLEPKAMAKINPLLSSIRNAPEFQLMVNINLAEEAMTVLLGKADNSPALSREVFKLPKKVDTSITNQFEAFFRDWKVTEVRMNGIRLINITK
jgi:hypothetical protein